MFKQFLRKVYQNCVSKLRGVQKLNLGEKNVLTFQLAKNIWLLKYNLNQSTAASKPKKATLG